MLHRARATQAAASGPAARSGGKLAHLIARRLGLIALVFVLLDILIVVTMYSRDREALAEDLIGFEVGRLHASLVREQGRLRFGAVPESSSTRGFALFDASGARIAVDNPANLPLPTRIAALDLSSATAREHRGAEFFVTGTQRGEFDGQTYWLAVAIADQGFSPLLPALGKELLEHVALPLVPLSVLLLAFNLAVVQRMLVPLERAVGDADRLDPAQPGQRLRLPDSPDEVRALLGALNRALDRIEESMLLLRQFTADAAHELRTPLAVMTLAIGQLPDDAARSRLQADAAAMARLVNQLLDLARVDALDAMPAASTSLDAMARAVVAHLLPLAISRGCSIGYVGSGSPVVMGDSEVLERALRNVIQNAIAHSPAGSAVEVEVGPGPQISVRDHGPGIPPVLREQVVQRFWRADRSSSAGAGLGLAITDAIMRAHGGQLVIDGADGGGARVALRFPERGDPS
jgi:two-component system OmpR family sensor kinase